MTTPYDSIKNQYRACYRDMAFKAKGAWHVYEKEGRFLLLPEAQGEGSPVIRNVQNTAETRLLSIMQELAAEAV